MTMTRKSTMKRLFIFHIVFQVVYSQQLIPTITSDDSTPSKDVDLPDITSSTLGEAFQNAEKTVAVSDAAENRLFAVGGIIPKDKFSAVARHEISFLASPETLEMQAQQHVFEEATLFLKKKFQFTPDQAAEGLPQVNLSVSPLAAEAIKECQAQYLTNCVDSVYRTVDGSCNNPRNPVWGRSNTCFERLLPAEYEDGISVPRQSVTGVPLPNARFVSVTLLNDVNVSNPVATHMTMQWGQFVVHDLILTPITRTDNGLAIECCNVTGQPHPECFPIRVSPEDPFFGQLNINCLNFVRSATCTNCTLGARQQTNQRTAYVDGSQIYGSKLNSSIQLRSLSNGELMSQFSKTAGELLPPTINIEGDQCSRPKRGPDGICFRAGDNRVNQQPGLTTMHTLWLRQHNRIARGLKNITPSASDEDIFQKARRLVMAQLQMIVYNEFLPLLIGKDYVKHFHLLPKKNGYTRYNQKTRPAIVLEFSTAAYRFGHSLIQNLFTKIGGRFDSFDLKDNFFFPFGLYKGDFEPILRGLVKQPAQDFDRHLVKSVTEHLYQVRGSASGLDLGALNIQRGRDLGLHGYTAYLDFCFDIQIASFADLEIVMTAENAKLAESVYDDPLDIDLFVGGLMETHLTGAVVGPTFGCIIGLQFSRLKRGDRYYFEHGNQTGSFTPDQLKEIRGKTTLSQVICKNTNTITRIQKRVLQPSGKKYDMDTLRY